MAPPCGSPSPAKLRQRGRALSRRDPEGVRTLEQEVRPRIAARPPDQYGADHAGDGDDQRHRADIVDDAGLQQQRARRRHRQEEREVDDDGMLAAIAHGVQPAHFGQQRARCDDGAGTGQPERERDDRPFADAGINEAGIRDRPQCQSGKRKYRIGAGAVGQREHMAREQVAGIDVDETRGEFVDQRPPRGDMRRLERRGGAPDRPWRNVACGLDDHEKHRQQVDEPQRAERLDERHQVKPGDAWPANFGGERGRLEAELDRHPEHVEICEMHHLAVEIGTPVAIDHEGQEQAGNQEEIGHPERFGEGDHEVHEAGLAGRGLDPQHRVHHHDHDDADAFGIVDPVDPFVLQCGCAVSGHRCLFSARSGAFTGGSVAFSFHQSNNVPCFMGS